MSIYRWVLVVSVFIILGAGGCGFFKQKEDTQWRDVSGELVSSELLAAGNLEMVWRNVLPIKVEEELERLTIVGNRVYALSDRNLMFSLNKENGEMVFGRQIGEVGFAVVGLELFGNELFSLIGGRLVELDPESGVELGRSRLAVGAVCAAARNRQYYYVGGADRRVHTLNVGNKVQVFEVAAKNDSMITSIVADRRFAIFGTDEGNVISIAVDEPKLRWQFDADGGIVEPMVRDRNSLFVGSKDTSVYKIDIESGRLEWKYAAGAMLEKGPRVTESVVYQYARNKGLAAIDKYSGKRIWHLGDGVDLLAESGQKAYVITSGGRLVVMDNRNAKQLYSVDFTGVSRYAANVVDSKIYIGDDAGRVACLRPIE